MKFLMPQTKIQSRVVVLGAGVVGLTTAIALLESGFHVTIVAEHLPGSFHPDYTSPWAGAIWRSFSDESDPMGLGTREMGHTKPTRK